jgi:Sec-independent protein translocase protein TatA
VAVIVLGPERIPEAAVQLARAVKFLRGYATSATAQMREEMADLMKEYEEVRKELQEFRASVRSDLDTVTRDMDRIITETRETNEDVTQDVSRVITDLDQPIIEPGGELPPELKRTDGSPSR